MGGYLFPWHCYQNRMGFNLKLCWGRQVREEQWLVSAQIFHVYLQSFLWLIRWRIQAVSPEPSQWKFKSRQSHAFYFVCVNLPLCSPPGCGDAPVKMFVYSTAACGSGGWAGGAGGAELPKKMLLWKETSLKLGPKCQIYFFLQRT